MTQLNIILNGDGAFTDLDREKVIHVANDAPPIQVAALPGGMASGRPSIMIRIDLPDGKIVMAETSARLFCSAARAIMGRYPDLFDDSQPEQH
jgi:hypothetical protein